jgi:beta-xylosidase
LIRLPCKIREYTFDRQHDSIFDIWQQCGAPAYPTADEVEWFSKRAGPALHITMLDGQNRFRGIVSVQPHGVSLIELQKYR